MKKGLIVLICIVELLLFSTAVFMGTYFSQSFNNIWLFIIFVMFSIPLLMRSYIYMQDSSLWIGSFLFFCGLIGFISKIYLVNFYQVYVWYIFGIAFASLMVFLFFRQNIHLKVFAIITLEVVILLMYKLKFYNFKVLAIINIAYFILFAILMVAVLRKNTRREE